MHHLLEDRVDFRPSHVQGLCHLAQNTRRIDRRSDLNEGLRPALEVWAHVQSLRQLEVGGVLADDMGLGKTLQTLAHILCEKNAGRLDRPAMVVMPTSLIPNWLDEAAHFTPQLKVLALVGATRKKHFDHLNDFPDPTINTYSLFAQDQITWDKWTFLPARRDRKSVV